MPKWKKWEVKVLVAQSCPTFCDPMDCHPPGSSVHGISQASILEWIAIPFFRGSSHPRNQSQVSCVAGRFFIWATREAQIQSPIPLPCSSTRETSAHTSLSFSWQCTARVSAPWSSLLPILPSSGWCPVGCWGASETTCQQAHLILVSILLAKFFGKVVVFLLLFNCSVVSDSLQPHGLQHARLPCPSPFPGACSNLCPLNWWCHPTILSSVIRFSSCPQSFPASGSFLMNQLFASGGQSIGASASESVLSMIIQDWFPLGLTGLILQSKELSSAFSKVPKHQFFGVLPSLWSNSHIHTWLLEKSQL